MIYTYMSSRVPEYRCAMTSSSIPDRNECSQFLAAVSEASGGVCCSNLGEGIREGKGCYFILCKTAFDPFGSTLVIKSNPLLQALLLQS